MGSKQQEGFGALIIVQCLMFRTIRWGLMYLVHISCLGGLGGGDVCEQGPHQGPVGRPHGRPLPGAQPGAHLTHPPHPGQARKFISVITAPSQPSS